MVIINTAMSCVTKLHGYYVLFSAVFLIIGVIEHRGHCSPKGGDSITTLVKIHVNIYIYIYIRPQSWDMYSKMNSGKNILVGVDSFITDKEIGKGFGKTRWHFGIFICENNGN